MKQKSKKQKKARSASLTETKRERALSQPVLHSKSLINTLLSRYISSNNNLSDDLSYKIIFSEAFYSSLVATGAPLIEVGFNFINIIILANKSLPGSALIGTIQNLVIGTGCNMLGPACNAVSDLLGKEEAEKKTRAESEQGTDLVLSNEIKNILKGALQFAVILSGTSLIFIAILSTEKVLLALGQDENDIESIQSYFKAYSFSVPATYIVHAEMQITQATGNFWVGNIISAIDNGLTSLLGFFLVYGKSGFPELGIPGLGWSATIATWINCLGLSLCIAKGSCFKRYSFEFSNMRDGCGWLKKLIFKGISSGLQIGVENASLVVYAMIASNLGDDPLSAHQINLQLIQLAFIPVFGINQAMLVSVSNSTGASKKINARKFGKVYFGLALGISSLSLFTLGACSDTCMKPFIDIDDPVNSNIISMTNSVFWVYGIGQMLDVIRIYSGTAIQASFDNTNKAMIAGVLCVGGFGSGLGYILALKANLGITGIALSRIAGFLCSSVPLFCYWNYKTKHELKDQLQEALIHPSHFPKDSSDNERNIAHIEDDPTEVSENTPIIFTPAFDHKSKQDQKQSQRIEENVAPKRSLCVIS